MTAKLIIVGVLGLLISAILIEVWLKRGKARRPLAERMRDGLKQDGNAKEKPELGMEATDLEVVEKARKINELAALTSDRASAKFRSNNRR